MNFKPSINVAYPPFNEIIFEEWFLENYNGCKTDRELIPIHFTSFWVNNGYGNDSQAKLAMQSFIDSLPNDKKYQIICQYDDGVLIDWKDKDVLEFNMSKKVGVEMPLLCQPKPFLFSNKKTRFANFIGSRTHSIRNHADKLNGGMGYYISFEPHNIERYCEVISESLFTLCFRGYGLNSFRIAEAMQYGSIPVYISDEFIQPFDADFEQYGILIKEQDAHRIDEILNSISELEVYQKQSNIEKYYNEYYTYEGAFKKIIRSLELEYNLRQSR